MKVFFSILVCILTINIGFPQTNSKIVGSWKYQSVKTTNSDCKDVTEFPINKFVFQKNGSVEFYSIEGLAEASYKVNNSTIILFDLMENGKKQDGSSQFLIKKLDEKELILTVEYECGSIDILFKK